MFPVCTCGFTDFFPMRLEPERGLKMQCLACGEYTYYAPYPMPGSPVANGNGAAPAPAPGPAALPATPVEPLRPAAPPKAARSAPRRPAGPKAKKARRR